MSYSKVANFILSSKHNQLYAGEKHGIIYLPDGTYNPAEFMGAGTRLGERVSLGQKGLSEVDIISRAHDERYVLRANNEADVQQADQKMIDSISNARAKNLDYQFNLNQAELIRLKQLANRVGFGTKEWFTSYGRDSVDPKYIPMLEADLASLEQQGYGKSRPRRLYKDDKGYYYKSNNHDESYKSYIKTGSNSSGRDLYIINLQNQKPVPRKAPSKKDGEESKQTKMIPTGGVGGGGVGGGGMPSTKQEVLNAYAQGVNAVSPFTQEVIDLINKNKELNKDLQNEEDPKKKDEIQQEIYLNEQVLEEHNKRDPEEYKQAEYIGNASFHTGSIFGEASDYPQPKPLLGSSDKFTLKNVNPMTLQTEPSDQSVSSFNASSDMGSSFNPSSNMSDAGSTSSDSPSQPVIEPVIETESLMPMDNTPEENSVSALEEKMGKQIKDVKTVPIAESKSPDLTKIDKIFKEFYSEPSQRKDFVRALRYETLDQMEAKRKKQEKETKDMHFEDISSARNNPSSGIDSDMKELDFRSGIIDSKTEDEVKDYKPPIEEIKPDKKFTHFSQIKTPTRRIKILLGESDLTPYNRTFLSDILARIPAEGRISTKVLNKVDKETIDIMWGEYANSIRTADQKDIIQKYLNQTGFGRMTLKQVDKEGLSTSDIEDLMKKYNHITLPVIASDEILELRRNITKDRKLFPFIMNLDPSDKPGSHWVAVVLDNRDKYVGYYDSLCQHPSKQILDDLKELVKTMDPIHMFKFKFNTVQDQSRDSGKCGMYAMGFLHKILHGMDFKRASAYFNKDWKHGESKIDRLMNGFGFI